MHLTSAHAITTGALCAALGCLAACEPLGPALDAPIEVVEVALSGQLEVYPSSLDFGTLSVVDGELGEAVVTAANMGDAPLVVVGLDELRGDTDAFDVRPLSVRWGVDAGRGKVVLQPGQSLEIPVRFQPPGAGDFEATLEVHGAAGVTLRGSGSAPQGAVVTESVDLSSVAVGCETSATAWLANTGDEVLRVLELEILGSEDISLGDELPVALAPELVEPIEVVFSPQVSGAHAASLVITTNDPEVPIHSVALEGLAEAPEQVAESFVYAPVVRADVLFVVDSTASVQSRLRHAYAELEAFFDGLDQGGVDWQVTVANGERDCAATAGPWIDVAADRDAATQDLIEAFGVYGEGGAELLELALATAERTDALDCLDGFLRVDTQLHVVLVTDRVESSPEKVGYYVGGLSNRLSGGGELVISAISGVGKSGCLDAGAALDAAQMTGGQTHDLCGALDWREVLQSLSAQSAATDDAPFYYTLAVEPVLESLELRGPNGPLDVWAYDPHTRRLTIRGVDNGVRIGDEVQVVYDAVGECG